VSACGGSPQPSSPSPPDPSLPAAQVAPASAPAAQGPATVAEATAFAQEIDRGLRKVWVQQSRADWINSNFITGDTDSLASDAQEATMAYVGKAIKQSTRFDGLAGLPPDVARQLKLLKGATTLPAPDDDKKRSELAQLQVSMGSTYGKGKFCSDKLQAAILRIEKADKKKPRERKDNCLPLGELSTILEKSDKWDELTEAWSGWHTISKPMRPQYERFVQLANEGAKEIGYANLGELWKSKYDMPAKDFEADTERLWAQVKPLYDDLHCYVRGKLQKKFGKDKVRDHTPIPAQALGNMWQQQWGNLFATAEPYPGQQSLDVTAGLVKKKYDSKAMVKLGEAFFKSLSMPALPDSFWERSLFEKPRDREVVCHASAWDLTFNNDLRIKMCIETNEEDLITIHHELGHNYYFNAYYTLPTLFQDGANDGFHEGIGDTLALSVTPAYLAKLGILDKAPANEKAELNVLMRRALDKVAFLPFGLLIDKWRWDVFAGKITPANYNASWWEMKKKYQGVAPTEQRSEADFDPGAKYHVPGNVPYTRYFLAHIYQFQFHQALCKAAGHKGPLHTCSIYDSKEAGAKLVAMLKMGASSPWQDAMAAVTGQREADASAILEYFAPLQAFLKEQNKGQQCGW